ncbi:ClpX C4-type zinc finger protein [Kitasatospora sp. NPDC094011]|uniref:ClpX C4-type zinc finger protein n=1 Tax=Kitasatospora sp. NPDC094011 TaxID=3364090 RepID=UPI003819FFBD
MSETICTQLLRYGPARTACTWCGATRRRRAHLVAGPGVNICSDCVELVIVIMQEDGYRPPDR